MSQEQLQQFKSDILNGKSVPALKFCRLILDRVSRTYALTIRALGEPFREPVLIGYLICRIADTYEDSELLSVEEKTDALNAFRDYFLSDGNDTEAVATIRKICTKFRIEDDEEFLALYPEAVLECYRRYPQAVKDIMTHTVTEMIAGMQATVKKQEEQGSVGTDSIEELEQYCYYVAGTVGNMLTDLFEYYSPWIGKKAHDRLSEHKSSFGEALQLTNIIKDAMGDLKRGVSFLPRDLAEEYHVDLARLYLPEYREQAKEVMNTLIIKAVKSLNRALLYSILLPKQEPRMRIFCIMPVLFAIKTLAVAVENYDQLLDPNGKVKITRDDVKKTLRFITINCIWDYQLVSAYEKDLKRIEHGLGIEIPMPFKKSEFLPIIHAE